MHVSPFYWSIICFVVFVNYFFTQRTDVHIFWYRNNTQQQQIFLRCVMNTLQCQWISYCKTLCFIQLDNPSMFVVNINKTLYLPISCMCARSEPIMLSLKKEYVLRSWNILLIDFCNSLANCWVSKILLAPVGELVSLDNFTKEFVDHWWKSTLIWMILWITSHFECLIT